MQKIDTKDIPSTTQIVQAWVNGKEEWRVYVNMEMKKTFDSKELAVQYCDSERKYDKR